MTFVSMQYIVSKMLDICRCINCNLTNWIVLKGTLGRLVIWWTKYVLYTKYETSEYVIIEAMWTFEAEWYDMFDTTSFKYSVDCFINAFIENIISINIVLQKNMSVTFLAVCQWLYKAKVYHTFQLLYWNFQQFDQTKNMLSVEILIFVY